MGSGLGVGVDLGFGLGLVSDGGVGGGTATVLLLESFKIQTFYNPIFRPFMIIFTNNLNETDTDPSTGVNFNELDTKFITI